MNIIFLIGQLRYSGAENVLRCIATEIAHAGHNVEIIHCNLCEKVYLNRFM